jgi:uncharacterized membrane protein YfcA
MSPLEALAIFAAGLAAGTINVIVGAGSLITFPTLLAFGYPPVLANVSNSLGLVPGNLSGAIAYRPELVGQRPRVLILSIAAGAGGLAGGALLLALPGSVFRRVVPALILLACVLIALQPMLTRRLAERGERAHHGGPVLFVAVFATGVYGGYFGAAQGVILIALLAIFLDDDMQRLNGAKNVLTLMANVGAACLFVASSHVNWSVVALIAGGSIAGGQLGAPIGRSLNQQVFRAVIVAVGVSAAIALWVTGS